MYVRETVWMVDCGVRERNVVRYSTLFFLTTAVSLQLQAIARDEDQQCVSLRSASKECAEPQHSRAYSYSTLTFFLDKQYPRLMK